MLPSSSENHKMADLSIFQPNTAESVVRGSYLKIDNWLVCVWAQFNLSFTSATCFLDLPQVDCERASENEGRSGETRAKVARRVDLFRLRNIEFNLHIVGAKKPQEQSTGCTGCTGLNYSKSTS